MPSRWWSPLGVSTVLFLLWGVGYVFLGIASPLVNRGAPTPMSNQFWFGTATDRAVLEADPTELAKADPRFYAVFRTGVDLAGMLFFTTGVLLVAVTWFGLRTGHTWALVVLAICGVAVPFYYFVFFLQPVFRAGAPFPFHPFAWVVLVPAPIAIVLGWIGLARVR